MNFPNKLHFVRDCIILPDFLEELSNSFDEINLKWCNRGVRFEGSYKIVLFPVRMPKLKRLQRFFLRCFFEVNLVNH